MKPRTRILILLLIWMSAQSPLFAAKVKKANGEIVEGEIQGLIVCRGKTTNVTFRVVRGKDIVSIDEEGLQSAPGKGLGLDGVKNTAQEDVLQGIIWWMDRFLKWKSGEALLRDVPGGGQVLGIRMSEMFSAGELLVGEARVDKKAKVITILSAIEVQTDKGIVRIPVADIVSFKEKPREPSTQPQANEPPAAPALPDNKQATNPPAAPTQAVVPASDQLRYLLLTGKTVAVIGMLGDVQHTGRGWLDPNEARAATALTKSLQKWGRYTIVDDYAKADVVMVMVESSRSGMITRGTLYDRLLVYKGGVMPKRESEALWDQEAKETWTGRPGDKLIGQLRKQVEEYEKMGPVVAPKAPEPAPHTLAVPPSESKPAESAPASPRPEAGKLSAGPSTAASDSIERIDPVQAVLSAKAVAVIASGPKPEGGAKDFLSGMLTGVPVTVRANAARAKQEVEKQIKKWNRYTVTDDSEKADLIFHIVEWDDLGILGGHYVKARLEVLKGGSNWQEHPQVLWSKEERDKYAAGTDWLIKTLRNEVEKMSKQVNER